jgi:hypothetical protein
LNGDKQPITFQAQTSAPAGDTVRVDWTDNIDGFLGAGETIAHTLSQTPPCPYDHTITATVTDTATGLTSTATVHVALGEVC